MSARRSPLATAFDDEPRPACRPSQSRKTNAEIARFAAILEQAETEIVAIVVDVAGADTPVYPADFAHALRPSVSSLTGGLVRSVETDGWPQGLRAGAPSGTLRSVEAVCVMEGLSRTAEGSTHQAFSGLLRACHTAYVTVVYESLLDWETARRYRAAIDRFFDGRRPADDVVKLSRPCPSRLTLRALPYEAREPQRRCLY